MRNTFRSLVLILLVAGSAFAADPAWQKITNPSVSEVAAKFKSPPAEYANSVTWGWNGPMTEEVIVRDLDTLRARNFRIATIEAGYRMDNAPYLSDEWFKLIRFAAQEAKKRDMRLIIIDEGKYPSGFVNGQFTRERPDLCMKALAVEERVEVAPGDTLERTLAPEVVGAVAMGLDGQGSKPIDITSGKIQWKAPEGRWQVVIAKWVFSTPDTRAVNDPNGAKTKANAMGDLINAEAGKLFIEWTHEKYKKHVGEFFGNTIIGFRGDEAEMTGIPFTPSIIDEFQKRKGYDLRPYIASFLLNQGGGRRGGGTVSLVTDEQRRANADYYDVWAELFAANFFDPQAAWCEANGLQALTHLNNDHNIPGLVRTTGDFFKALRKTQVPGVDVIWSQVYPGKTADFVKFPASASHLFGRPRALSESFAAYNANEPATYEVVRFATAYQMVRGINYFEFMFMGSSAGGGRGGRGYMIHDKFPELLASVNRATYVLSQGRPAAQIGVYMPTMSIWMNDNAGNQNMLAIADQLVSKQHDFDFIDDASLASGMKLQGGEFINASGQSYRAMIIPSSTAISKAALDRLQAFAKAGGKVVFAGKAPTLAVEKSFLKAGAPQDLSWAMAEPSGELSDKTIASLPKSDVVFAQATPAVKAMHRKWRDADVYYFFNESDQKQTVSATVAGAGQAQVWETVDASISKLNATPAGNGFVQIPVELEAQSGKLVVIGAQAVAMRP